MCQGSPSLCEYFNMQESIKLGIREIVHRYTKVVPRLE